MKKQKSISRQIILVNMTIGLLLLVTFFSSFFFLNWKAEQESRQAADKALQALSQNFEWECIRLTTLMDLCRSDRSFLFSSANRLGINDFVEVSMETSDKLALIRYSLPYATNIFLYVQNNEQVVRLNRSVMPLALFLPSLEEKLAKGEELPDFNTVSDGFHNYARFSLYVKHVQNYGCLVLEVDPARFCNLSEVASALQSDFIVLDGSGNVFAATSREKRALLPQLLEEEIHTVSYEGVTYQVNQELLPRTGYRFVMLSPNTQLENSRRLLILFSVLASCLLFAACLLLILLNQRIYSPLRSIIKKMSVSGKDEFDAINRRFEELLTENTQMSEQIHIQQELQENIALNYAFHSSVPLESGFCEALQSYGYYRVAVVAVQDEEGRCPDFFGEADSYLTDTLDCRTVRIDGFCHAYLIPEQAAPAADAPSLLREYLSGLSLEERVFVFAGISKEECDPVKLPLVYQQARRRMLSCAVPNRTRFSLCAEEPSEGPVSRALSLEVQNTVTQSILKGGTEETEALLQRVLFAEAQQTLQQFTDTYRCLCSLVAVLLAGKPDAQAGEWMTQRNRPVYNPVYMYQCAARDCGRLHRLFGGEQHALRYQIAEYIRENYSRPLSLDSIAEQFGITSVYLSSWFKKNVGINLSVYLSNYRMEKAKEILRADRNIRLAELAQQVGIPSVSTFIRQFKNHTGTTPEQYRKLGDSAQAPGSGGSDPK